MPSRGTARKSGNSDSRRDAAHVFVPQDLQGDVLALQLAVDHRPIGLSAAAMALLLADRSKELRFQRGIGHLGRQRPVQSRRRQPLQSQPTVETRHSDGARSRCRYPGGLQPKHFAHMAHCNPLCWHRSSSTAKPKERTLSGPAETPPIRARSNRIGWATSSRIRGRLHRESAPSPVRCRAARVFLPGARPGRMGLLAATHKRVGSSGGKKIRAGAIQLRHAPPAAAAWAREYGRVPPHRHGIQTMAVGCSTSAIRLFELGPGTPGSGARLRSETKPTPSPIHSWHPQFPSRRHPG